MGDCVEFKKQNKYCFIVERLYLEMTQKDVWSTLLKPVWKSCNGATTRAPVRANKTNNIRKDKSLFLQNNNFSVCMLRAHISSLGIWPKQELYTNQFDHWIVQNSFYSQTTYISSNGDCLLLTLSLCRYSMRKKRTKMNKKQPVNAWNAP